MNHALVTQEKNTSTVMAPYKVKNKIKTNTAKIKR